MRKGTIPTRPDKTEREIRQKEREAILTRHGGTWTDDALSELRNFIRQRAGVEERR